MTANSGSGHWGWNPAECPQDRLAAAFSPGLAVQYDPARGAAAHRQRRHRRCQRPV